MSKLCISEDESLIEDILINEFYLRCTDRKTELQRFLRIENTLGRLYMKLMKKTKEYERLEGSVA